MYLKVIELIEQERARQNIKWGYPQNNTLAQWGNILTEELGEAIKELNELDNKRAVNYLCFIDELVQVAAVSINILEHLFEGYIKELK